MKVLVLGSGGREHALVWKLSQSPHATEIFCAPGNAGIARMAKCLPATMGDPRGLAELAASIGTDLTIVGPEAPLVAGIADVFEAQGLRLVGPSHQAAMLEGSKIFAKEFMTRHAIPTARFVTCDSPEAARFSVSRFSFPVVVKADGLAAGKGVQIVNDEREYVEAVEAMMIRRVFGSSGERILLEECLVGREASLMVFTDGRDYRVIAPAQDYKRVDDGDRGPNTGGMGSFSAPLLLDQPTMNRILREIIEPAITGMVAESHPFRGILYAGLMLTADGPKVVEFNARLGDPETQVVMMRLESDLVETLDALAGGNLASAAVRWTGDSSVCVVMASAGYPGDYATGKPIDGLDTASALQGVAVFHAGTTSDDTGRIVTSGGRVLGVTARGSTLDQARTLAYSAVREISFEGAHYRTDIALVE